MTSIITDRNFPHKQANWEEQVSMLKMVGSLRGGRKKRTRKKYQKGGTVESVNLAFGNLLTSLSWEHAVLDDEKATLAEHKDALTNIDRALIDHIKYFIKNDLKHITVKGKKTSWFQFGKGSTQSSVIYNYWKKYIIEYCEGYGQGMYLKKPFYRCEMKEMAEEQKDGLNILLNNYIYINIKSSQDTNWFDAETKNFVKSKDSVFHRAKDEIRAEAAAKEKNGEGGRKKRTRKRIKKKYKKRRTKKKKKRTKKKRRKRRKKTRRRK